MKEIKTYITSESVTEGHPDKVCDKIADSILDEYLSVDKDAHVACEVCACANFVLVMGEVLSKVEIDKKKIEEIVRKTIVNIGYDKDELGFNGHNVEIEIRLTRQSPDINMGVGDDEGAGDQGMMFGLASNETESYMPAPISFAHKLAKRLEDVRKQGLVDYLRPDGKTQVSIEYINGKISRIDNIVVSTQHDEKVEMSELKKFIINEVIEKAIPADLIDNNTKFFINQTGRFCVGGPAGDSGLTGRKIIVDTYGGACHHGGGAFSGKDPSKVDRSAAYMTRYIAKNIVASGLIPKIEIGLSYVIGASEPTSIMVDTFGFEYTNPKVNNESLCEMIKKVFPLQPKALIKYLNLRQPMYKQTTNYGHFGKDGLSYEKLDKVEEIRNYFK